MKKIILFIIPVLFTFAGCDSNPIGALIYPDVNNSTTWAKEWVLYDDDVKTRGSFDFPTYTDYWATRPSQLTLEYDKTAHTGRRCILISWDGSPSDAYDGQAFNQVGYVGFGLQSANPVAGIDISPGNYRKLKFWAKGSLNSGVVLRVETEGATEYDAGGTPGVWEGVVSNSWQEYEVTLKQLSAVKDMFRVILKNTNDPNQSNGGTVYIDDVRFTQ